MLTAVDHNGLRYALTDKGRVGALEAMERSGYTGPAPITLEHYETLCLAQSVHRHQVTLSAMHAAFADTVIPRDLLDQLGSAVHSARPIFVYGLPGTGKTFITQRVSRLLGEAVYVPHAVAVGEEIFQLFDPAFHHALERPAEAAREDDILHLQRGHDPRLVHCRRPFVMSGGELTMAGLEVGVDERARLETAPLQLKASNGIYLIDDLGRQRMPVTELFNRWIVPMESKQDYLTLASGKRFQVPFDVILIFSTNLEPRDLADDAFLRRIGHKIHFKPMPEAEYRRIWQDMLAARELQADPGALDYLIERAARETPRAAAAQPPARPERHDPRPCALHRRRAGRDAGAHARRLGELFRVLRQGHLTAGVTGGCTPTLSNTRYRRP